MIISIIIPNYNGVELLKKNFLSVFKAANYYHKKTNNSAEIIVVDDASTDDSIKYLKKEKVKLIQNNKNLGFASSINKGVLESSGEILVLLNTDVSPKENFLVPLVKHFEDERIFAVGCMDKSIENGKIILRGRGIGKWQKGILVHRRGEVDKTDTLWVAGGSGAFRKSLWEKLGGFDPLYNPFYWEDIDLSYRAIKSGYKILFEPESIVVHRHEEGSIKKKYSESDIKIVAYRNQFIFSWKNATDWLIKIEQIIFLPYFVVAAIKNKNKELLMGLLKALMIFLEIVKSGNDAKKYFTLKDQDILR